MKLTSRQRKFIALASGPEGYSPWDPPKGAPVLRNPEIHPLIDANLIRYIDEADVWITTPAGLASLDQDRGGNG